MFGVVLATRHTGPLFETLRWGVALFEARLILVTNPQATQSFGLCALGLAQVKAAGLVRGFRPRWMWRQMPPCMGVFAPIGACMADAN